MAQVIIPIFDRLDDFDDDVASVFEEVQIVIIPSMPLLPPIDDHSDLISPVQPGT